MLMKSSSKTMKTEFLENLGFTSSEIKIYLTLLELNSASVAKIAEKSGLYRRNVYDTLARLMKKGLVSFSKVGRTMMFIATDPQRLVEFIDLQKKEVQSLLPELKNIYKAPSIAEDVLIFKGKEGLKAIFEEIIRTRGKYAKIGAEEKFKHLLPYYYSQYQKRKVEYNIKCKAIHSENERNEEFVQEYIGEVRFLPKEFISPSTTMIYGGKVAIIIWKENPWGIVIKSPEVAENYTQYFELLWANAKK